MKALYEAKAMRASVTLSKRMHSSVSITTEEIVVCLSLIAISISPIISPTAVVMNVVRAAFGFSCLLLYFAHYGARRETGILATLACVFSVLSIVSSFYNGNESPLSFVWVWTYMGIGCLAASCSRNSTPFAVTSALVTIVYLAAMLMGADPNTLMVVGSRNNISVVLLLILCLYYLVAVSNQNRDVSVAPSILCFVACVMAEGRAGVLVSLFIVVVTVLRKLLRSKRNVVKSVILILVLIAVAGVVVYLFWGSIQLVLDRFKDDGFTEDGRQSLLSEYFAGLGSSVGNLLFGVPFEEYHWLSHFENPHNSFVLLHSRFGLIAFLFVVGALIRSCCIFFRQRKFFLLLITLALAVRSITDSICFSGIVDVFWWAFVLKAQVEYRLDKASDVTA